MDQQYIEKYISYSDSELAALLSLDGPIDRAEMIHIANADDVPQFAAALTAAMDSQIYIPGAQAVTSMYRAALARAEAAEALAYERLESALFAEQRANDAELAQKEAEISGAILAASDDARRADDAVHALEHCRARVAALEAELAAVKAAGEWRPMGGDLPSTAIEIRRRALVFPAPTADEPPAVGSHPHGWFICWWTDGNAWEWRPVAGSSAMEEPQP